VARISSALAAVIAVGLLGLAGFASLPHHRVVPAQLPPPPQSWNLHYAGKPAPSAAGTAARTPAHSVGVPAAAPVGLVVPSVGLAVPVGSMNVVNGIIDPPTADRAYWIQNRGSVPASNAQGTVFIAGHSWSLGFAPFNLLYNPVVPSHTIKVGALIYLQTKAGQLVYQVRQFQRIPKALVDQGKVPALLQAVPGRLVVMTCAWYVGVIPALQNGDNIIITAQLIPQT